MTTLYLLSDDLRLADNPALNAAAQDTALAIACCIDESLFTRDRFGCQGMGPLRWQFQRESLLDLNQSLAELGHTLQILRGSPLEIYSGVLNDYRFDRVIRARGHEFGRTTWWQHLERRFPQVEFTEMDTSTLLGVDQIRTTDFSGSFSAFRRRLGDAPFRDLLPAPASLPEPVELASELIVTPEPGSITGGALAAQRHLESYFSSSAASTYKETRNYLEGESFSTGLSPFLANGCLSPVQIAHRLEAYEEVHGANESTQWILFELLWREFFKWYGWHHGENLYAFAGISGKRPLTSFYQDRFNCWCDGNTPWDIVNACMQELKQTGQLSNRGRQLVASCLVNELGLDWRCGASYFAQQLIDYDPCSNWGNWQYVAGVGADPRGGRHFNLEKQAEQWDPDQNYRSRWCDGRAAETIDSFDYYGWPQDVASP